MKALRILLRVALGGAICGSLLGVFLGGLLGGLVGAVLGNVSLGLDAALLAGAVGGVAGAVYGAVLVIADRDSIPGTSPPGIDPPLNREVQPKEVEECSRSGRRAGNAETVPPPARRGLN